MTAWPNAAAHASACAPMYAAAAARSLRSPVAFLTAGAKLWKTVAYPRAGRVRPSVSSHGV